MFYDQAILIQWLKEWDGRPARLFCFIRYGRDRTSGIIIIIAGKLIPLASF
jgi:hypothetical protein